MKLIKHIGTIDYGGEDIFVFTTNDPYIHICIYLYDSIFRAYEYNTNYDAASSLMAILDNRTMEKYNKTYPSLLSNIIPRYYINETYIHSCIKTFMKIYNREQNLNVILE